MIRLTLITLLFVAGSALGQVRISEVTDIEGVRSNHLSGLGIVVGLRGTGDGSQAARQMMQNILRRNGVNADLGEIDSGNYAIVMVTAEIDPFRRPGSRIDITVSSIQKASSLFGGELLQTHLKGPNGKEVYVLASGSVVVGGAQASGESGSSVGINHTTVGRIAGGGFVEKGVPMKVTDRRGIVTLQLKNPDWRTATNIARAISKRWAGAARAQDSGNVAIRVPADKRERMATFIAAIQNLVVKVDSVSRVVINEKTGVIVVGSNVRVSTVAVSFGSLSVTVNEQPEVTPSAPFTQGPGATVVPRSDVRIQEENRGLEIVEGGESIARLSQSLDALGASPRQLIAILQEMKAAGALHAELVVR